MALSQISIKDESVFLVKVPVIEPNLPFGRFKVLVDLNSNLLHVGFVVRV